MYWAEHSLTGLGYVQRFPVKTASNFKLNKKLCIIVQGSVFVGVLFSWIVRKSRDFDRDVTFTSVLAVTRKWNVVGVYLQLLYNMRSKQVNLLIILSQL